MWLDGQVGVGKSLDRTLVIMDLISTQDESAVYRETQLQTEIIANQALVEPVIMRTINKALVVAESRQQEATN